MAGKKTNTNTQRRSTAEIDERNRASVEGLKALYGPKGDGKKPAKKK